MFVCYIHFPDMDTFFKTQPQDMDTFTQTLTQDMDTFAQTHRRSPSED